VFTCLVSELPIGRVEASALAVSREFQQPVRVLQTLCWPLASAWLPSGTEKMSSRSFILLTACQANCAVRFGTSDGCL
jgi:hypothetical protein